MKPPQPKPTHYRVIGISMYTTDIEQLEAKVAELKRRGWTKANKSQLIRIALSQLDATTLPIPYGFDVGRAAAPAVPSDTPPPAVVARTTSPRPSRMRLRRLTAHEIGLATKHPAIAELLGVI